MPRTPRNILKKGYFHVLLQGVNREFIFNTKDEMNIFKRLLFKFHKRYNIKIVAYCIMNNHAHILVKIENISDLSRFMHKLNSNYATYYNSVHDRVGHVFRNRYKSQYIYNKRYLYNCINYIHNNPVKAGICEYKEQYLFSSYRYYKKNNKLNSNVEEYDDFIDIEGNIEIIVSQYLNRNNITKEQLIEDNEKLKELIIKLKFQNKISFRKIEKNLNINREKLRRLAKVCQRDSPFGTSGGMNGKN